jgi:sugar lactone lactonase YvrE
MPPSIAISRTRTSTSGRDWPLSDNNSRSKESYPASTVIAEGARIERLAGGFYNISGAAVNSTGQLYFVDAHWQRTTFIPAAEDFVTGKTYYGTKMAELLRAFGLARATAGKPFYVSDESEQKTYVADVDPDGTPKNLRLFAECGGESVTGDPDGNVYIAAGQIYVYSPAGRLLDTINVPERPIDLVFGGADGRTLFILARSSLYSVETRSTGS